MRSRQLHKQTNKQTPKRSTKITFRPGNFETTVYSFWKNYQAFARKKVLNKGIRILSRRARSAGKITYSFTLQRRNRQFDQAYLNKTKSAAICRMVIGNRSAIVFRLMAMQYNDSYDEKVYSFATHQHTVDGGTHLSGFSWVRYQNYQQLRAKFQD